MENKFRKRIQGIVLCATLVAAPAMATAAPETTSGGLGLATLSGLLSGGGASLASNTMSNATGVLQFCLKNNLIDNKVSSVKQQLMEKLGLTAPEKAQQNIDYKQGLMGLLKAGDNKQIDLSKLGDNPLAKRVKTKACDVVLNQAQKFLF